MEVLSNCKTLKITIMKRILLISIFILIGVISNAQTFDWVNTTGSTLSEYASKIAIDGNGNSYVLGYYSGTIDLNPSSGVLNSTAAGGTDIYIQKFNASGNFINAISIGGPGNDLPSDIVLNNNGNLIISGTFQQFIDLDPSAATNGHAVYNFGSSTDFFIAKYDDLAYASSRAIGGPGEDVVQAMDVDSNNNLYLTGIYRQTVDFNPNVGVTNTLTTTAGGEVYVLKLDENLDYIWAKSFATTDANGGVGKSIKVDSSDNVIVAGTFKGACDFDPSAGTTQNETAQTNFSAGFVVKLTSSGNFSWKAVLNTTNNNASGTTYTNTHETFLESIALDSNDNIVVVGTFRGRNIDFDPSPIATLLINSDSDVQNGTGFTYYINTGYLWKLNPSGNYLWSGILRTNSSYFSTSAGVYPYAVTFDVNDNFYISGHFRSVIDLNPTSSTTTLTSSANNDVFIGKFSETSNALIWARSFGGANNAYVTDLKISNAKMLFSGRFDGTVDFDPNSGTQSVISQGGTDAFLLSLNETSLLSNGIFDSSNFSIYPNPVSSTLNLLTELSYFNFTIYSVEGKIVKQGTSNRTQTAIDVSNLNTGIYIIELESNGSKSIQKIIKN